MHIAVISDLHLGQGDRADRFEHDDAEFLQFLNHLERNFERIVLLGDIFETLTCPRPAQQVKALHDARAAHPEIVDRFDRPMYRYVHGNHDLVAAHVLDAPGAIHLQVDGQRILFTHGHGHDWIINHARWVSEWAVWSVGWMMRMGLKPLAQAFETLDRMLSDISAEPDECGFQRWAVNLAQRTESDIIVTGHTHVGVRAEHGDRLFLNSGTCARGGFSFLTMDTARGDYQVQTSW